MKSEFPSRNIYKREGEMVIPELLVKEPYRQEVWGEGWVESWAEETELEAHFLL